MTAIPSDAATVMLLRPNPDAGVQDIEVLMMLRHRKSSFVPGYHVFPGGVIDPDDFEPEIEPFIRGMERAEAARMLADMSRPEKALGAWVAAIRETFEEAGMLVARKKDGTPVPMVTAEEIQRFAAYRQALIKGKMKFARMLEAEDLVLPAASLHYFSHWITPEVLPLRYDVRFFVAEAPAGQSASHDGVEMTDHIWLRPSAALEDYKAGKIGMVLPQIMTLVELSRYHAVADVIAAAENRKITANLTKISRVEGRDVEVMPDGSVFAPRPPEY